MPIQNLSGKEGKPAVSKEFLPTWNRRNKKALPINQKSFEYKKYNESKALI
jgi:hypothetical protein